MSLRILAVAVASFTTFATVGAIGYVVLTRTHTHPPLPPPTPFVVESCDVADVAPNAPKIRLGTLTKKHVSLVDVAAGREESPAVPGGTLFVTTITHDGGGPHPTLFEWDVSRARATFSVAVKFQDDKVYTGYPAAARVASGGRYVYVATEFEQDGNVQLRAFNKDGTNRGYTMLSSGNGVSLAAAESWVAVAFRPGSITSKEQLHLFSTPTGRWRDVATKELDVDRPVEGQRRSVIAFVDSRLFVAEQPSPTETRVSELAVPSLKVLKSYSAHHAGTPGHTQLSGTDQNRRLFLLDHGTLTTLTMELDERGRTAVETDEVAIGPSGEILGTTGLDARGVRGELVKATHHDASCTPAWSGQFPVLACAVDEEGGLIARFPATAPRPWGLALTSATLTLP